MSMFFYRLGMTLSSNFNGARSLILISSIIWAITLFWPESIFIDREYAGLSKIMSEKCWASTFLVVAGLQLYVMVKFQSETKLSIAISGFTTLFWWFLIVTIYSTVYPPPALLSGDLTIALVSSWIFIKSGAPNIDGVD